MFLRFSFLNKKIANRGVQVRENYKLKKRDVVFKGYVFDIERDEVELPTGKEIERYVVKHPGAVVILPRLGDGSLLLVSQYRYSVDDTLLEFPAGTLEVGEDPLPCAQREIQEEVGHAAKSWQELGIFYPAPGFCSEKQYGFLATDLTPSSLPGDEDEFIEVKRLFPREVEDCIKQGQLMDAKSIAIFLRAKLRGLL